RGNPAPAWVWRSSKARPRLMAAGLSSNRPRRTDADSSSSFPQTMVPAPRCGIQGGTIMPTQSEGVRKFAGQSFNLNDEAGGKSGLYARLEAAPQGRVVKRERIACATDDLAGRIQSGGDDIVG